MWSWDKVCVLSPLLAWSPLLLLMSQASLVWCHRKIKLATPHTVTILLNRSGALVVVCWGKPDSKEEVRGACTFFRILYWRAQLANIVGAEFKAYPRLASYHRGGTGDALNGGTGWRAADSVKDVKRVRKNALHAIFHRTDLEERVCGGKIRYKKHTNTILDICP